MKGCVVMTGKLGAKWAVDKRRPPMKKVSIRLTMEQYDYIQVLCAKSGKSAASLIQELFAAALNTDIVANKYNKE